jgi:hypothetical protein
MKVDLSAALKALQEAPFVKSGYATVRPTFHADDNGTLTLQWDLYAYSSDGQRSSWVMNQPTFDAALVALEKDLRPTDRFVEEA